MNERSNRKAAPVTGRGRMAGAVERGALAAAALSLGLAAPLQASAALPAFHNGRIAFASNADGDKEIYTIEPDGTGLQQITFNTAADTSPVFSPDGKRIAWAGKRGGDWDILVAHSDGSGELNVTSSSDADDTQPTWSPDGASIAFTSNRTGKKQIFIYSMGDAILGKPPVRQITTVGRNQDPSWGVVNGEERIYYTSNRDGDDEIYYGSPNGGFVTQLTANHVPDQQPRWSPSGTITFQRKQGGNVEIWRMNAGGTGQQAVTSNSVADRSPAGSPDGKEIVFLQKVGGDFDLVRARQDGTQAVVLLPNADQEEFPSWEAVKNLIVYPAPAYDVSVVPHGTSVDVYFRTYKSATSPSVRLFDGGVLAATGSETGTRTNWAVTIDGLVPGKTYDMSIVVYGANGGSSAYDHPEPIGTLKRKVTVKARYAFVWDDTDDLSCGDMALTFLPDFYPPNQSQRVPDTDGNACTGETWNFPNKSIVVDDYSGDTMTVLWGACDYDEGGPECAYGSSTLDLLGDPESFTRTATVAVDQEADVHQGGLDIDVTFDYKVEYHP